MRPDLNLDLGSWAVHAVTMWAHRDLAIARIWLEIEPGNEPSLQVAQRAACRFEQRLTRHCRDWACEDAERDSWHDRLIWAHVSDQASGVGREAAPWSRRVVRWAPRTMLCPR